MDFHNPQFVAAMQEEDGGQKDKQTEDADEKGSDSDQWGPSNPQTLNRYAYALNNPVRYTDPTGHFVFLAVLAVAAIGFGSGVAMDVGIDYVTAEDKSKFDVGASVTNSVKDPWTWIGAIPGAGVLGKIPKAAKVAGKVGKVAGRLDDLGDTSKFVKRAVGACGPNSFSADTEVATAWGELPIGSIQVGDWVLAYDEASGTTGYYTVTAVMVNDDPVIVHLTLDGELIETTPEHPFYTWEGEWVDAGKLWVGAQIREADGEYGTVQHVQLAHHVQTMYNLEVAQAHTFFVGDGQWLVHNCAKPYTEPKLPPGTILERRGVTIEHYYHGNDHRPAHLHVRGAGPRTTVGAMGRPVFRNDPPLSPAQAQVIQAHRPLIRRSVNKIARWLRYQWKYNRPEVGGR